MFEAALFVFVVIALVMQLFLMVGIPRHIAVRFKSTRRPAGTYVIGYLILLLLGEVIGYFIGAANAPMHHMYPVNMGIFTGLFGAGVGGILCAASGYACASAVAANDRTRQGNKRRKQRREKKRF